MDELRGHGRIIQVALKARNLPCNKKMLISFPLLEIPETASHQVRLRAHSPANSIIVNALSIAVRIIKPEIYTEFLSVLNNMKKIYSKIGSEILNSQRVKLLRVIW